MFFPIPVCSHVEVSELVVGLYVENNTMEVVLRSLGVNLGRGEHNLHRLRLNRFIV